MAGREAIEAGASTSAGGATRMIGVAHGTWRRVVRDGVDEREWPEERSLAD